MCYKIYKTIVEEKIGFLGPQRQPLIIEKRVSIKCKKETASTFST